MWKSSYIHPVSDNVKVMKYKLGVLLQIISHCKHSTKQAKVNQRELYKNKYAYYNTGCIEVNFCF